MFKPVVLISRISSARLVADKGLNGKPVDKLTLVDVTAPAAPAGFTGKVDAYLEFQREKREHEERSNETILAKRRHLEEFIAKAGAGFRSA